MSNRDGGSLKIRKYLLTPAGASAGVTGSLDLATCAKLGFSAEDPSHPIENILDEDPNSYWSSDRDNTTERLLVEFDAPQNLSRLVYEVQETRLARTQEIRVELSQDSGRTYRGILTQEYTFSPEGATLQREDLRFEASAITQLRLTIVPNKNGSGRATLTSLHLYA
jgi:F5/8 type C domain-containing protein